MAVCVAECVANMALARDEDLLYSFPGQAPTTRGGSGLLGASRAGAAFGKLQDAVSLDDTIEYDDDEYDLARAGLAASGQLQVASTIHGTARPKLPRRGRPLAPRSSQSPSQSATSKAPYVPSSHVGSTHTHHTTTSNQLAPEGHPSALLS